MLKNKFHRAMKLSWPNAAIILAATLPLCMSCDTVPKGTNTSKTNQIPDQEVARHALAKMESCEEFVVYAKAAAIQRMLARVEEQREQIEWCWNGEGDRPPGEVDWETDDSSGADSDADADTGAEGPVDGDVDGDQNGENPTHTDTNVQEIGVDEADFIKTDGNFLYTLSNGDLVLVTVGEAGALTKAGRLAIKGTPTEMFLYKDLVVVFSALYADADIPESLRMPTPSWVSAGPETDWDYDYPYYGNGNYTQISFIDVSDKANPTLTREILYAGAYVTSRRINESLRAVVHSTIGALDVSTQLNWYDFCSLPEPVGKAVFEAAYEALIEENIKLIQAATQDEILPKKIDRLAGEEGTAQPIVACSEMYGPETPAGSGLLTVVTADLENSLVSKTDIATFGDKGIVYASPTSLYLTTASEYVDWAWRSGMWKEPTSGIHKFDIATSTEKAIYKATGEVTGRMLNQFCLGEHEGFLRVASTTGSWDWTTWDNRLSIFEEIDGELVEISYLDNIGVEEEIYGARFIGTRGFIVTFRQTDPLYTFDLSDPENPLKVGEWEGPGYSSYLHPFGQNHMLTMGRENWQVTISLYNLTDFANPELVTRTYLDGQDTWEGSLDSAAVNDHKAFTFLSDEGLLAIPYDGWTYSPYEEGYDTGIALFDVDQQSITPAGQMSLNPSTAGEDYYRQESPAKRAVFIGDLLYGISNCRVTSADPSSPAEPLDSVQLFTGDYCGNNGTDWEGDEVKPDEDGGPGDTDVDIDTDTDVDTDSDGETSTEPDDPSNP